MNETNRRRFLRAAAGCLTATGLGAKVLAEQRDSSAGIPTRPLGKTGERVSIVGLGGYHIGTAEERDAIAIMHEAIDQGMTFFDNSWDYHNGGSEEVMGKALSGGILPSELNLSAEICRRFALSLPISTLVCGIRSRENLRQDLAMARSFKPITKDNVDELLDRTAEPGRNGEFEKYKTTRYGSAYHFRQHGE